MFFTGFFFCFFVFVLKSRWSLSAPRLEQLLFLRMYIGLYDVGRSLNCPEGSWLLHLSRGSAACLSDSNLPIHLQIPCSQGRTCQGCWKLSRRPPLGFSFGCMQAYSPHSPKVRFIKGKNVIISATWYSLSYASGSTH